MNAKHGQRNWKTGGRVLLLLVSILLTVGVSQSAFAQGGKVTYKAKSQKLATVLNTIKDATGVKISWEDSDVRDVVCESVDFQNASAGEAIVAALRGSSLECSLVNGTYIVKPKGDLGNVKTFSGKVTDSKGAPLPGAYVYVKETRQGTTTDVNGKYTLSAKNGQTVIYSFMGMVPSDVRFNGQSTLNVTLEDEVNTIDDVVVTGVATRRAESYTGAFTAITGDELKRVGNQNVFQSLKNLDPSLYIVDNLQAGSNPNVLPEMNMRGGTSFTNVDFDENLKGNYQNQPNQPLFLLDGFEVSAEKILDMDMNLIESMTILKDAAAKAIYGSKAANGVILIETSKLNSNKPRVTYTASVDLQMPDLSSYDLCSALEKLDLEIANAGLFNPAGNGYESITDINEYYRLRKQALSGESTYWLSKPVRFGYGQKHSATIEFGENDLRNKINISYNDVEGVMKGSKRGTLNAGITTNYKLNENLRFNNYASVTSNKAKESPYGSFQTYTLLNPYISPYDENGEFRTEIGQYSNPLLDASTNCKDVSSYLDVMDQASLDWTILPGLTLRGRFSVTAKKSDSDTFYPASHTSQLGQGIYSGYYKANNGESTRVEGDILLNYNKTFNEKHIIFSNLRANIGSYKYSEIYNIARGFPSDNMSSILFAMGYAEDARPGGYDGIERELGYTWTGSYSYMDRYFTDVTLRTNASSQFGVDKPWANFWSLGIGWNLHNESFMADIDWVKRFKVTASIGTTGNQNFASNKSLAVYQYNLSERYGYSSIGALIGSYAANMENPALAWEQKLEKNLGIDTQLGNLALRVDVYNSLTKNLVTSLSTARVTGYSSVSENIGNVENKGIEIRGAYKVFQNRDGFFNVSGTLAHNTNRIKNISDAMKAYNETIINAYNNRSDEGYTSAITTGNNAALPALKYEDGNDMNAIWVVRSGGIDPATGYEVYIDRNGNLTYTYSGEDLVCCGTTTPKVRGNFGFNGEYKGIGLSVTCTYLAGGQYYNSTLMDKIENIDIYSNVDRRVLTNRWKAPGDDVYFRSYSTMGGYNVSNNTYGASNYYQFYTKATSRFVQDRNEINLSQISLYYDLPRKFIQPIGLERLKFTVYMNDIATFSSIGIERGTSYPYARTLSFSLSATF